MAVMDAAAAAALDADIIMPGFFIFMDFVGDPLRFCTLGFDISVSGTGFAEMDGHVFSGVGGEFIDISPVQMRRGGSDQVTGRLSGLNELDNDTMNLLANPANWQGRDTILWRMIRDENCVQRGGIQHYYTGRMSSLFHEGEPGGEQSISVVIDGYLSLFAPASNRTYADSELFDPLDLSGHATSGITLGTATAGATPISSRYSAATAATSARNSLL